MTESLILHATTVALGDRGVLISGPSGSGKSALGLMLMALGCDLVADDRTLVTRDGNYLTATCPASIQGLIEARGVGILLATARARASLHLAVALDQTETERFPPDRQRALLGCKIPLLHKVETGYFAAAILQYLKAGKRLP